MKVLVTGGYAVGKSSFVQAVSQLPAVSTDVPLSAGVPAEAPVLPGTAGTTAAMDFGRTSVGDLTVCVFATPGHPRFWTRHMIDALAAGALGAVVLVDTVRLTDSFPILDDLETRRLPYLVAINPYPAGAGLDTGDVRNALNLPSGVPVVACNARHTPSSAAVLAYLVGETLAGRLRPVPRPAPTVPAPEVPPPASQAASMTDYLICAYGGVL